MGEIVRPAGPLVSPNGGTRFVDLTWTTAEGEEVRIGDMDTKHMFNAMKMCFNHLAAMWGGEPVWFTHRYADYDIKAITGPQRLAKFVIAFQSVIDARADLPAHYREPYALMKRQITSRTQALPAQANPEVTEQGGEK